MKAIGRSWRGEEKLWHVFWLYHVLGGIALVGGVGFGVSILAPALWRLFGLCIVLPYLIWVFVSLWRGAFNCEWKGWAYISRAYVLLMAVIIAAGLVGGLSR